MWGKRKSNGGTEGQSKPQKHDSVIGSDKYWARMRRLNARLTEIESAISTIKRDLWRIEKKSSREAINSPTETQTPDFDTIIGNMLKGV